MNELLGWLVAIQADIHRSVGEHIAAFSSTRDWPALAGVLPVAVLFGVIHAMTPGHNKTVLATYVAGGRLAVTRAATVAGVLAATHIGSAVAIALGAGFLVPRTLTTAGQAPLLENLSRYLLLAIGVWLAARAIAGRRHGPGRGIGFGMAAGLVPCPLTLFVMVFAVSKGVPEAGLAFAGAMLAGVGSVLVATALLALATGRLLEHAMLRHGNTLALASRSMEVVAGMALVAFALADLVG